MSIKVHSKVWDDAPYKSSALLVALALADFANDEGVCWPSIPTLAAKARISERQVIRVLGDMERDGVVAKEKRFQKSNVYRFLPPYVGVVTTPTPIGDKMSHLGKSVTKSDTKSDTHVTQEQPICDTHVTPYVTPMSPDPLLEPSGSNSNNKGDRLIEVDSLRAFFEQQTALFATPYNAERDWSEPLQKILDEAGSVEAAQDALQQALSFSRGNNKQGKTYAIRTPRSVLAIALNLLAESNKPAQGDYVPAEQRRSEVL